MPVFTNSQQVTLVLQSLLLGVGIGAVYDMLRALRLHFRCGWAGVALLDTLFWASVRRYLKHPELLEGKPTEENAYPAEECV